MMRRTGCLGGVAVAFALGGCAGEMESSSGDPAEQAPPVYVGQPPAGAPQPDQTGAPAPPNPNQPGDLGDPDPGTPGPDPGNPNPDPGTPDPDPGPEDDCGDARQGAALVNKVYYGTLEPTFLPLTPGQILAVGNFYGCSGTLIAPRWVLSANHCGLSAGAEFCMGHEPGDANVCVRATRAEYSPSHDTTLLELERDATEVLPDVVPIPIITELIDQSWYGRTFEASGYGQMENGGSGTRKFTAEPLVDLSETTLSIDGEGRHGVCFGDSGGPVMTIASDGTVRVAGDLSNGDGSCVGVDNYARVDNQIEWIEQFTGPMVVDGAPCGAGVDLVGRCMGNLAMWCDGEDGQGGTLATEQCQGDCGFDPQVGGFRCIQGPDPCGGFDLFGACEGGNAKWCDGGVIRTRDCGACGEGCQIMPELGGVYCAPDPCGGLDYLGQCNGDVVEYCKDGEYKERDCGDEGLGCAWVSDDLGYWCE